MNWPSDSRAVAARRSTNFSKPSPRSAKPPVCAAANTRAHSPASGDPGNDRLFRQVRIFARQRDDNLVDSAGEGEVVLRLIVVRDRRAVVHADIEGLTEGERATHRFIN